MITNWTWISGVILMLGVGLSVLRILKGPTVFDRLVAFDCFVFLVMGIICLESIQLRSFHYIDVLLILSLLGFINTVSIAAYVEGNILD
jgi:multisubunit Na+/H+ antiporter MnhF subunit